LPPPSNRISSLFRVPLFSCPKDTILSLARLCPLSSAASFSLSIETTPSFLLDSALHTIGLVPQ
jgi:hypothetical protein